MSYRESPPAVNQLEKLALIGGTRPRKAAYGASLHEQEKYFAIDSLDSIVVRGEDENLESVRHSMGVRMGRRVINAVNEVCRLEYVEAYHVECETHQQIKSVTKYKFEWNKKEVLLARRATLLTTSQERGYIRNIGDTVLNFYVPDDAASILDAEIACAEVTYDDCEQFIKDTNAYYKHVNLVNR
ncbi:MAG: hypothetical protein JWO55_348 [Candidatus Saccharibacteria bacterium]|jgi:hypothetical protein|nr:hypothetical protein [Candidatus Saccharibacteria bacterium]